MEVGVGRRARVAEHLIIVQFPANVNLAYKYVGIHDIVPAGWIFHLTEPDFNV